MLQTAYSHKILDVLHSAIALSRKGYAAATSDRAIHIYKAIGNTILTTVLLAVASVLLLIDLGKAIHNWCQARSHYTYVDFENAAKAKVEAVAVKVVTAVKGQRDRACLFLQESAATIEMEARLRVLKFSNAVGQMAVPQCTSAKCGGKVAG